jgi:hypothetical protein
MTQSSSDSRNVPIAVSAVLAVVGLLFFLVAVIYFKDTAAALPSYFPGHQAGSGHKHVKHGIVAAILGIVCLGGAWLGSGSRSTPKAES